MATFLLKGMGWGYFITLIVVFFSAPDESIGEILFAPIFLWPVTLGITLLSLLILKAIDENK